MDVPGAWSRPARSVVRAGVAPVWKPGHDEPVDAGGIALGDDGRPAGDVGLAAGDVGLAAGDAGPAAGEEGRVAGR